jgi:hypothetical protein
MIWIAVLGFVYTQLKDTWPQLAQQTTQLWNVVSTSLSVLKGPLKEYCFELLQDADPELSQKL